MQSTSDHSARQSHQPQKQMKRQPSDDGIDESTFNKISNKGLDLDDVPIPVSKPKTFEELLEEEIAKGGSGGGIVAESSSPKRQIRNGTAVEKKEFLRRKTEQTRIPSGRPSSKYKYYIDNFRDEAPKEESTQPKMRRDSRQDNKSQ